MIYYRSNGRLHCPRIVESYHKKRAWRGEKAQGIAMSKADKPKADIEPTEPERTLPPAARRALAEAEARRTAAASPARPEERGGRDGLDPTRYGDWEAKGLASDF
jgi:hypothetical protein